MDAEVTLLYIINKSGVRILNASAYTPQIFQSYSSLNTQLYISITEQRTGATAKYALDYSRMITETRMGQYSTWSDFEDHLTEALVLAYETTIPGYKPGSTVPINQVVAYDVMNTTNMFDVDYADYQSGRSGIFTARFRLLDLAISLQENASDYLSNDEKLPDLSNCVPIVNGLICRPYYNEDRKILYARNGAKLNWQLGTHRTPEIQLLDFSNLGGIIKCGITSGPILEGTTDFAVYIYTKSGRPSLNAAWKFTSQFPLTGYTPILVLGGTAILPDELYFTSEYSFTADISHYPLHRSLAFRKYLYNEYSTDSANSYDTEDVLSYLLNQFNPDHEDFNSDCFVLLVKTPHLYVRRIHLDVWHNQIIMNLYAQEGLLLHDATQTLRVYHCARMTDKKELTVQNIEPYYISDYRGDLAQVGFIASDCQHNYLKNIQRSTCTMVHIFS